MSICHLSKVARIVDSRKMLFCNAETSFDQLENADSFEYIGEFFAALKALWRAEAWEGGKKASQQLHDWRII